MGADMLLAYCIVPEFDDGSPAFSTDPYVRQTLRDRVGELTTDDLDYIADMTGRDVDDDEPDPYVEIKEFLYEAIDEVLGGGMRRDVVDMQFHDSTGYQHWYLFTGGMSYGDSPSEAWDYINALAEAGITNDAIPKLQQVT